MNYLAFDLGAESGRTVLGRLEKSRLELEVLRRFPNRSVLLPDGLHWDTPTFFPLITYQLKNRDVWLSAARRIESLF